MWGSRPDPGDWVRTTATVPTTLADHFSGTGLPTGTRGVVTGRVGGRVTADFDTGYGIISRTVDAANLAVSRRRGGQDRFNRSAKVRTTARLAVALFLIWPFVQFAGVYVWQERTFDGLVESLAVGTAEGALDFVSAVIEHPMKAVLYLLVLTVMSKFAFGS